jgi:hypothetical protein
MFTGTVSTAFIYLFTAQYLFIFHRADFNPHFTIILPLHLMIHSAQIIITHFRIINTLCYYSMYKIYLCLFYYLFIFF